MIVYYSFCLLVLERARDIYIYLYVCVVYIYIFHTHTFMIYLKKVARLIEGTIKPKFCRASLQKIGRR